MHTFVIHQATLFAVLLLNIMSCQDLTILPNRPLFHSVLVHGFWERHTRSVGIKVFVLVDQTLYDASRHQIWPTLIFFLLFIHPFFSCWQQCIFGPIRIQGRSGAKLCRSVIIHPTAVSSFSLDSTHQTHTSAFFWSAAEQSHWHFFSSGNTLVNVVEYQRNKLTPSFPRIDSGSTTSLTWIKRSQTLSESEGLLHPLPSCCSWIWRDF